MAAIIPIAAKSFFFQRDVDTVQKATENIMEGARRHLQQLSFSFFSGMTLQQLEISRRIDLGLQQLRSTYEHELHLTVDKANEFVQKTLLEFDNMIHKSILEPLSSPAMQELMSRFQMAVSNLPCASDDPYVRAITPTYLVPFSLSQEIVVEVHGNFPLCGEGSVPMLTAANKLSFAARTFHQQLIQFRVPDMDLFPETLRLHNRVSSAACTITIPSTKKMREYRTTFYLLPENPGKLTLHFKKISPIKEVRTFSSPTWRQNSRLEKASIMNRPYTETAPQGWTIIEADDPGDPRAKAPRIVNEWAEPSYEQNFVSIGPNSISCTVSTYMASKAKHAGKVDFHIDYTAFRLVPYVQNETQEIDVRWGTQLMLEDTQYQEAYAALQLFDGSEQLYDVRQSLRDTFISIIRTGNRALLSIRPPLTADPITRSKM